MELATVTCALCGRSFEKPARRVRARNSCCAAHARKWNAQRLADYNRLENPLNQPGGVVSNRRKRREALAGTGEGKAYRKFYGRHEHRAVAEAMPVSYTHLDVYKRQGANHEYLIVAECDLSI